MSKTYPFHTMWLRLNRPPSNLQPHPTDRTIPCAPLNTSWIAGLRPFSLLGPSDRGMLVLPPLKDRESPFGKRCTPRRKTRQCRRFLRATDDVRTIGGLTVLAEKFDAKAEAVQASARTLDLLGDGIPGSLVPDDEG